MEGSLRGIQLLGRSPFLGLLVPRISGILRKVLMGGTVTHCLSVFILRGAILQGKPIS